MFFGFRSESPILNCRSPSVCTESSSLFVSAFSDIWKHFPFFFSPKIKLSWNFILVCLRELTVGTLSVWEVLNLTNNFCLVGWIILFKCRTQCARVVRNMQRVEKTRTSFGSKNVAFAVLLQFFSEVNKTISQTLFWKILSFGKVQCQCPCVTSRSWVTER